MKKLTLLKGKAIACLILMCLALVQGCKKDLLQPNSNVLDKSISIEEAKQYFENNLLRLNTSAKLSSSGPIKSATNIPQDLNNDQQPMWDAAQFKDLSLGTNAVLTPLYRPGVFVNISEKRMVSYGFLNYLMMYKDAKKNIVTEWVELMPSEKWIDSKFSRKYDGKILVKDWGGKIKKIFFFNDGEIVTTSKLKKSMLASANGKIATTNQGIVCYVTKTLTITTKASTCPCKGHTWEQLSQCDCNVKPTHSYTRNAKIVTEFDCDIPDQPIDPPAGQTPGGTGTSGNNGNLGNGGTTNPNDYAPSNCNSDPNATIPTTPLPPGTKYLLLCSTLNIPVEDVLLPNGDELPLPRTSAQILIDWFNSDPDLTIHISDAEAAFLESNQIIATELLNHLNSESIETKKLGSWAVGYLTENPQGFNQAFMDLLNGIYNEKSPVYIPKNFSVPEDQEWNDSEDEAGNIASELYLQGLPHVNPIPEAYYINGTGIDMTPAYAKSRTVKGAPRNADYFWKQLMKKRPEMFSDRNRMRIANNNFKEVEVDAQWVKYNPTHKSYMFDQIVHHHDEQGEIAYAIPRKVHTKWTRILHIFRRDGKVLNIRGALGAFTGGMQLFSFLVDIRTGNPDAWVNWYGNVDEIGKIYKNPTTGDYFEITNQIKYKNSAGEVTRAIVTYNVYADYVWDEDEKKYMGVVKLGKFTEDIDMKNKHTVDSRFKIDARM